MAYVYLGMAIVSEVAGTLCLSRSAAFTRLWPSVGVALGYGLAFYFLSLVLQTIPTGTAYAIWAGVGTALIALSAWLFFGQRPDLPAVMGIALIIAGVVVLQGFSKVQVH